MSRKAISVHIGYPADSDPDDEAWLSVVAARHSGELSDYLLESDPPQRDAWFETRRNADDFVAELTDTGRWRA